MITLYLEEDESLVEILKRVKESEEEGVNLVVPQGSILFKNPLNLKILLTGAKKEKKRVSLISSDDQGFSLAQKAGFPVSKSVGEAPSFPSRKPFAERKEEFVEGKDIAEILSKEKPQEKKEEEKKETLPPKKKKGKKFIFAGIFLSLVAILILGGLLSLIWYLPLATIKIYVEPKTLSREENLLVSPDVPEISLEEFVIPGLSLSVEEKGEKTIKTTGTDEVGEKASGIVTIYNKQTDQTLSLSIGSLIASEDGLKYALGSGVTVEKATISTTLGEEEFIQTLTPGKETASVTAVDIGAKYNLAAFVDKTKYNLTIDGYDKTLAQAANREEISGGSSREIKIVTEGDKQGLLSSLKNELSVKGKEDLNSRLTGDQKLLDEAIREKVLSAVFSSEAGEETEELTLNLGLEEKATVYSESLLKKFFREYFSGLTPEGYQLGDKIKVESGVLAARDDGKLEFFCKAEAALWPEVNKEEIKINLVGKRPSTAEEYLRNLPSLKGYKIELRPNLPSFLQFLPKRTERIKVELLEEK